LSITVDDGHWLVSEEQEDELCEDFWLLVDGLAFRTGYSRFTNIPDTRWNRRKLFEMNERTPKSSPLNRIFGTTLSVATEIIRDPVWFMNGVREAVDHPTTAPLMLPERHPS